MTPFVLIFAQPIPATRPVAYGYSEQHQVNLTVGGMLAAEDPDVMSLAGPTYSSAGSKTHADDTD